MQQVFERILNHDFEVAGNGSIAMPDFLKDRKIKICDREYQMGIGGLHSCRKKSDCGRWYWDFVRLGCCVILPINHNGTTIKPQKVWVLSFHIYIRPSSTND